MGGIALGFALTLATGCEPATPSYVANNPALRAAPLYFYPAVGKARAWLFFFGNDVGFWAAHQKLARALADRGIDVVGFDVRSLLHSLPDASVEQRENAYADTISALIRASRHELGADTLPVLIGGHSIGAELAIYSAAHVNVDRLAGVLALSPGERGHLRITLNDLTMASEPQEEGSFSVAEEICEVPIGVRVAVIRGAHDKYRYADSLYERDGGTRYRRWLVPFSGHSLKTIGVALPEIESALKFVLH